MMHVKTMLAMVLIAAVVYPEAAFAKKKQSSSTPAKLTSEQRNKMLAYCNKKYPLGSHSYNIRYETHYGQKTWWCVPVY